MVGKVDTKLSFNDIAWAGLCFYYRSVADRKYCKIMSETQFIEKLRRTPSKITPSEFEQKIILDHINISSYDLLIGQKLAECTLEMIVSLQPDTLALQDLTLLDCDLSDNTIVDRIKKIYSRMYSVSGLWVTGVSKIVHLINDRLFPLLNLDISTHFGLLDGSTGLIDWFKIIQDSARQISKDFHDRGFSGTPEEFISRKLGYYKNGYHKSLVKYLDEYYWLRFADNLPVPPLWIPKNLSYR